MSHTIRRALILLWLAAVRAREQFKHPGALIPPTDDERLFERADPEVEADYREFWLPILTLAGALSFDQLKRELYDYHQMMGEVSRVYEHVTGGRISKLGTRADAVISVSDDVVNELIESAIKEHDEETSQEKDGTQDRSAFAH